MNCHSRYQCIVSNKQARLFLTDKKSLTKAYPIDEYHFINMPEDDVVLFYSSDGATLGVAYKLDDNYETISFSKFKGIVWGN